MNTQNNKFTQSLLRSTDFDVEKIAALVGVSSEFVEEVKKQMEH